ncbi:heparinase II/III family protein [Paenibacillus qinlingensis]|nr:heparinase II/III family protein [Paenibacillus qinlingensis]NQX63518.1 heparinase II/III family protein [Paenibacillus qinlingensis]
MKETSVDVSYVQDWQAVQEKIRTEAWAKTVYDTLVETTEWWVTHYADDPRRITGWGHNYFCEACGSRIDFEREAPHVNSCGSCGHVNKGARFDQAWNYLYRDEAHKHVFYAGVLYQLTGDERYPAYIRSVLSFYCDHYEQLQVDVPAGYVGKIAGINLCDAVGMIWLLQGMEMIKETFSTAELQHYKSHLFNPQVELLEKLCKSIHNITCWMKAAVGMTGMFFGDSSYVERALEGPFGLLQQLQQGVTAEGFWYEGSFHYHFYCVEPFTYFLLFARMYEVTCNGMEEIVKRMYVFPAELVFDNGVFPNPNDGWPNIALTHYAGQYEYANRLFPDPAFEYALSRSYGAYYRQTMAYGGMIENSPEGWVQRLLFGKGEYAGEEMLRVTTNYPASQICSLRAGKTALFMKYGLNTRSHAHPDVMNIELFDADYLWSHDISSNGYGSFLFLEWQRKTIAHNTVVVDGVDQVYSERGMIEQFEPERNRIRAKAKEVYPGVDYARDIQLQEGCISDTFEVITADEHQTDWLFHCQGRMETAFETQPCSPIGSEFGYQHLMNLRVCTTSDSWSIRWIMGERTLTLRMEGCIGTDVYVFEGYEDTTAKKRSGVLVRRQGCGAAYRAVYTIE